MNKYAKLVRRWALSIDIFTLSVVIVIIGIGIWFNITSTPAVAVKLGLRPFYFVEQHIMTLPVAIFMMLFITILRESDICRFAAIGYIVCFSLLIVVLLFGQEIKGAHRWIRVFGFSVQPSEFLKPVMIIITAWLISEQYIDKSFPGIFISTCLIFALVPFLLLQPDIGITIVLITTWCAQLFVSGLSVSILCAFGFVIIAALFLFYFIFPHFAERINSFLYSAADSYQIQKSLAALKSGGFFGKGPGEGVVKNYVPDAHSDFVFSVIGEEFGFFMCFIIVLLFACLIVRALIKAMRTTDIFEMCVIYGIAVQIAVQVVINISTSLNLIPTKGMTLPFISYGGSSLLATSINIGILLSITRKNGKNKNIRYRSSR